MERSFIHPQELEFHQALSNAKASRDAMDWYGLNDFAIFNPYIHYIPKPADGFAVVDDRAVSINYGFAYAESAAAKAGKTISVPDNQESDTSQ
tara:strand:- start:39 stop:317 length:279 start_codon:yes stop_codon:yes gene_type:complete